MKEIRQGIEHPKHRVIIKKIVNELDAEEFIKRSNVKGFYSPDARKDDVDFEVEMFCKHIKLQDKSKRWDSSRQKVLVIGIESETFDLFDSVLLVGKDGEFIEIK